MKNLLLQKTLWLNCQKMTLYLFYVKIGYSPAAIDVLTEYQEFVKAFRKRKLGLL